MHRPWSRTDSRNLRTAAPPVAPQEAPRNFDALRDMDLFSTLNDSELARFIAYGSERRVAKGSSLAPQRNEEDGQTAEALGVLVEGDAVLAWGNGEGDERLIRTLGPGDMVGEIPVFDETSCGATARAVTAVRLMEWRREDLVEAMHRWPGLAMGLLGGMAHLQRQLHRRVAGICNQRAPRRLALALTDLIEEHGVLHRDETGRRCLLLKRPPTRRRISEIAGMARETVSRLLVRWEESGWIALCGNDVLVLDPDELRRMAGA